MSDPVSQGPSQGPVNPLPPVVVALFLVVVGVEAIFTLGEQGIAGGPGAIGWRLEALQDYAFSPRVFDWMVQNGRWPAEHLLRFVSYPFVHGGLTQTLFAAVMLLALGKLVAETFGEWRALAVFVVASVLGAVAYGLVPGETQPLFGAFPAVYGWIGTFTYLMWLRLGQMGEQQLRAFTLIGILLGLQLVFALIFDGPNQWLADLAGFAAGFVMTVLMVPGGWARLMAWLRRD